MGLRLVTAPTAEPISIFEAKQFLRVDYDDQDIVIQSLIQTAREKVEIDSRRQLMPATWMLLRDNFPRMRGLDSREWHAIRLPFPPLQSVTFVKYTDGTGTLQTVDSSLYIVDTDSEPARVKPTYGTPWPIALPQANSIQIQYVCGYASKDLVPERAKHAIRLLVSHLYENREAIADRKMFDLPMGYDALINSIRTGDYMSPIEDASDDRRAAWASWFEQGAYL